MNPRARSWALKMYKEESVSESVPVRPDGQIVFQNLAIYNNENWPKTTQFAKVGSEFCQILNKPSKYCHALVRFCHALVRFCQNGKISPNLITLLLDNFFKRVRQFRRVRFETFYTTSSSSHNVVYSFHPPPSFARSKWFTSWCCRRRRSCNCCCRYCCCCFGGKKK